MLMKRLTVSILLLGALTASSVVAQDKKDEGAPAAAASDAKIPYFGNESCPYMKGKRAKQSLFVETAQGRVFVCCKDCIGDAKKDGEKAAAKAYPSATKIENKTCPVSGAEIGAKAVATTWQGYEFKLGAKDAVETFKKNPDLYLSLLTTPGLKDLGNKSCPVSDKEADGGCVIVGDEIVRVRSRKEAEEFKKDVAKNLAKAKAGAKKAGTPADKPKPPAPPKKG
jgi:hypothetical protein